MKILESIKLDSPADNCEKMKIWIENIICRDFTKRQIKILSMIHLFCMHNSKMECHIPHLSSFEVTGLGRSKIREEIEKLVDANVLTWDTQNMIFKINNSTKHWNVKLSENFASNKVKQILDLNNALYKPPGC